MHVSDLAECLRLNKLFNKSCCFGKYRDLLVIASGLKCFFEKLLIRSTASHILQGHLQRTESTDTSPWTSSFPDLPIASFEVRSSSLVCWPTLLE